MQVTACEMLACKCTHARPLVEDNLSVYSPTSPKAKIKELSLFIYLARQVVALRSIASHEGYNIFNSFLMFFVCVCVCVCVSACAGVCVCVRACARTRALISQGLVSATSFVNLNERIMFCYKAFHCQSNWTLRD